MIHISNSIRLALFFFPILFLFFTALPTASQADSLHHDQGGLFFLSSEEAAELNLSDAEWAAPPIRTRGTSTGPRIEFQDPIVENLSNPTLNALSPLNLTVLFQENSAPIDMSTLELVAKKGFFSKSLTDRIKPFIDGNSLKVTALKIPSGKFKIQVTIADVNGNKTRNEYRLVIQDQ